GPRCARRRVWQEQDALAGQARRQMREEFLRGCIDPVHVLENEDEWRSLARSEKHVTQRVEGPFHELRPGHAIEEFGRRGDAEKVGEQDDRLLTFYAQELKLVGDAMPQLLAG